MALQLTTLITTLGTFTMLSAWYFVGQRMHKSNVEVLRPVRFLHNFFLCMGIFFAFMTLPTTWLYTDPSQFPLYMAWGYVLGHVALYVGLINIARMICTITPKLASKERFVPVVGVVVLAAVSIYTAITMVWGNRPTYNYEKHLTEYTVDPIIGAAIGLMAVTTLLPACILFLRNAFKSQGPRRTRSLLIGSGFGILFVAGPLHDIARNWQTYMIADLLVSVGIVVMGVGVIYKFEQNLSSNSPAAIKPAIAPTNTV